MIAIVDSGSTKADWIFTDGKKRKLIQSKGMNPNFIGEKEILKIVRKSIATSINVNSITEVNYFGTGCGGALQKKIVSNALKKIFTKAKIKVDHDISAAVLATCGNEKGIACIIGTGSNSVYYDGKNIHHNNYGLGYILADEGAGTYLGKKLVTHYLYGLLPKKLSADFKKQFRIERDDVIKNVYGNPTANSWLASFAGFYTEHKSNPWIRNTLKDGFREFIKLFVMNFPQYKKIPVHFVGSIAYHHKNILQEVVAEKKLLQGKIIQKPIDELAKYFITPGNNYLKYSSRKSAPSKTP